MNLNVTPEIELGNYAYGIQGEILARRFAITDTQPAVSGYLLLQQDSKPTWFTVDAIVDEFPGEAPFEEIPILVSSGLDQGRSDLLGANEGLRSTYINSIIAGITKERAIRKLQGVWS